LVVDPPRLVAIVTPEGPGEILEFGREADPLPECPWPDAGVARRRSGQLEAGVRAFRLARRKERAG
jgi:hypothetical protein